MSGHAELLEAVEANRPEAPVPDHAVQGGPRADYRCGFCTKAQGSDVILTSLPVGAQRCPMCGHKRGFTRIFDGIQVSTKGRRIAAFIDPQMTRAFDTHSEVTGGAKRFEKEVETATDRFLSTASPEVRQAAAQQGRRLGYVPAGAALGSIDPAARRDSREANWPMVNRTVKPLWHR